MTFREATRDDLPWIVRLLANDPIAAGRESLGGEDEAGVAGGGVPAPYLAAFEAIEKDPNNSVVVAELGGEIAGCLQLTYIPGLTYTGGERAQIEGVRVAAEQRGRGIGQLMVGWAIEQARARGCRLVQLTTDRQRPESIRFYQKIGFRPSHMGMKYHLDVSETSETR
ncbi:GNAT family N-acetyltransferase [Actinomadura logoneensis]|uniref:GNAT family N-acetyltransferase n=1 Tax=Actinomadura logoneensis TaxID=2293572 RepID=A0A372JQN4_9ACTN|nr:GNAT family N-acetyltransferase [Actinomadura logoneensis]RFU42323.1 GNAT family N-acetyltransferase [Actinomadura logoneensis]